MIKVRPESGWNAKQLLARASRRLALPEHWRSVLPTAIWLAVTVALSVVLALMHSPLTPLPGVVTLLLVPGAVIMTRLRARPANTEGRLVLATCLSMMAIMVVGGVASLVLPIVGISHPLNVIPESVIWFLIALATLEIGARSRRDPVSWIFDGVRAKNVYGVLASGVLVAISILAVAELNHSGDYHLAVFSAALDIALLLIAIVGGWSRTSRWPLSTLLYSASLALLLLTSLRGGHLYGWDIQQEYGDAWNTIHAGVWKIPSDHDPYASMLSLTVLPAILHSLVKLRLLAFFQLLIPAILSLLPVAVYSTVRCVPRYITSGRVAPRPGVALAVVTGLIISSVAYSSELVSITRQAMAMTLLAVLVMVLFDRSMLKRPSQITIGLLIVAISFTHYTTSYLLATIFVLAWLTSLLWSKGWLGTPISEVKKHQFDVRSRKVINLGLVVVALVAALGWNLVITRNNALGAPSTALTAKGLGLSTSTNVTYLAPRKFENILENEFRISDPWISPVPGSGSVRLVSQASPESVGVIPSLGGAWQELSYLAVESLWVLLGLALLYGIFRLGRYRTYGYSSDLVGLGVAGLLIGGFLRFSGTLAAYFDPERAAILTAILLSTPLTLFFDDVTSYLHFVPNRSVPRVANGLGLVFVAVLTFGAYGLDALFFGGDAPGSLSATDWNAQNFTVSTPELATAVWLRDSLNSPYDVVQTDFAGQIVLLSEPGAYHVVPEIVPPEIDSGSYIYLSTANLVDGYSVAEAGNGAYSTMYRTPTGFFNQSFNVVYSTGVTRIYH